VIADPVVAEKLADTKAANEVRVLNSFYEMLKNQPDRAFYGYNHCLSAANAQAIEDLLVTDQLFRYELHRVSSPSSAAVRIGRGISLMPSLHNRSACDIDTRRKYISLCDQVTDGGGQVHVFSALHVSGERTCTRDLCRTASRVLILGRCSRVQN